MENEEYRRDMLLKIYDQMFNDINRHILVVWQSIGVLIGAFTIFALSEKGIISIDVATSIIVLICGWLFAHLIDASYWYNRNLVIIANIEKQFLLVSDLKHIHYYFGKHRPDNKMIAHLRIQFAFGIAVLMVILAYHFYKNVLPSFHICIDIKCVDFLKVMPYILAIAITIYIIRANKLTKEKYLEFIKNSPGIDISTKDIIYGPGHGFDKSHTEEETKTSNDSQPASPDPTNESPPSQTP